MNTYPISNTNKELLARLHSLASSLMEILPISAEETPEIMQNLSEAITAFTQNAKTGASYV